MKIWTSEEKSNDRIIAIIDDTLYKCNPSVNEINDFVIALRMKNVPEKKTLSIPTSYIRQIQHEEGKKYIQVFFGQGSEEHFRITDEKRLQEVFEQLQLFASNSPATTVRYTWWQAGKKPLIALGVVTALFIWTLTLAIGIEAGTDYDVVGHHYNSLAGIVLMLANFGVRNVIIIFVALMAIAGYSFIKKARKPPVFHVLKR